MAQTPASAAASKADIFVSLSGPSNVYVGQNISYSVSYGNSGPDVATGVVITDTMPAGTSFAPWASDPCWSQSGSTLSCTVGTATVNAVGEIALTLVAPNSPGTVTNTATITMDQRDHTPADNTSTFNTSVTVPTDADVTVGLSASPAQANVGDYVTFFAGVTNEGPATATNVTIHDTLPQGFIYVPDRSDSRCVASGQTVTCALGSMGPRSVDDGGNITAQATASWTFSDTATVTADQPDPNTSNNSATTTVQVIGPADMAVAISGPNSVDVRTVSSYTISVSNLGPDDVGAASLDVNLPAQMSPAGWSSAQGNCQGTSYPAPSYHCDLGPMSAGSTLLVIIDGYAYQEGNGSLTAAVTGDRQDPDTTNNNSQMTITVNPVSDLQVAGGPSVTPGKAGRATVTFTLTVYNAGPSTASSVNLSDTWSGTTKKLQMASFSITQGTCTTGASTVDCSIGSLDPGATATLTVTLTTQGSGTVTDTGTVSAAEKDPDASNNSVTSTATI